MVLFLCLFILFSFFYLVTIGAFDDPDVIHVEGEVEPIRDLDIISEELRLKDVETLMKSLDKLEKVAKGGQSNDKKIRPEYVCILNDYLHLKQISKNQNDMKLCESPLAYGRERKLMLL